MVSVAYVNVYVRDLERAVEFYRSKLGLSLERSDTGHGYASFDAGPVRPGLAVVGPEQTDLVGRMTGVGLAVHDLEAAHARLASEGVAFPMPPSRQPWGGFMALVADP